MRFRMITLGSALLLAAMAMTGLAAIPRPARPVSEPAPSGPADAIRAVLTAQQAAWNRGDLPAFVSGYWNSPDLTFSGATGITRGYSGVLERYQKAYPDKARMGELEFAGLEIRALGPDAALVLGHWHLKRTTGDAGGVFSLVFQRFSDGWRIIHDHTSAEEEKR